jgi:hypothetical protein
MLDTGDRARREVAEQSFPVEGTLEGKPQQQAAVRDEAVCFATARAQHPRRVAEHFPAGAVELTQASVAGGERDLRHTQVGVVQQSPCEVHTCRAGESVRRDTEVGGEQAA